MRVPKAFMILSIAGLLAILSSTASKSPTLPLLAEHLGVSKGELGLIAAASTITGIVVNVVAGTLSDIYGRRRLLLTSGLFFATSPFLYLLVREPWQLTLVRVYHGVATATFTPVATATIADMYRERRGEMMGFFSSATMIGRLLAPTIAGTMITLTSFNGAYTLFGIFGTAALIILFMIPKVEETEKSTSKPTIRLFEVLMSPRTLVVSSIMAVTYFAMQSLETFLPLYMSQLQVEAWLIGLTFTIQLLVITILKPYTGRLADNIGRLKVIVIGMVITSVGVLSMAFSTIYYLVLISIVAFAVGVSFTTAAVPPLVSEIASEKAHGAAIGAMETIKDIGQALGPIVMGLVLTYTTYKNAFMIVATLTLLATLIVYLIRKCET